MNGVQAEGAVFKGVNALFAAHETVEEAERTAYIVRVVQGEPVPYIFVTFASGEFKAEGEGRNWKDDLDAEVASTIRAVAAKFPGRANERVIWRTEPVYEVQEAHGQSHLLGRAEPERSGLYMRCVAVPKGAVKPEGADRG